MAPNWTAKDLRGERKPIQPSPKKCITRHFPPCSSERHGGFDGGEKSLGGVRNNGNGGLVPPPTNGVAHTNGNGVPLPPDGMYHVSDMTNSGFDPHGSLAEKVNGEGTQQQGNGGGYVRFDDCLPRQSLGPSTCV